MALPFHVSEPGSPRAGTAQKRHTSFRWPGRRPPEAAHALVAAGDARNHQVAHRHRRAGGVVVLVPVGHLGFPEQRARGAVEGDEMGVVGRHEQAIAGHGHAAIDAARRHADQAARARPAVVPDLAAAAGVERVEVVGGGDVHHAVHDHRRHLQLRGVRQAENPVRRQPRRVRRGDLRERAVAVAVRVAVIGGPVGLRRHLAVCRRSRAAGAPCGRRRAAASRRRSG